MEFEARRSENHSKSFFGKNNQFQIEEDKGLSLNPFLDASRDLVKFIDLLGPLFKPVSSDIRGNIGKIGKFILNHCDNICYLNQIVEFEKSNIKEVGKNKKLIVLIQMIINQILV